jgi:hypothetical protein
MTYYRHIYKDYFSSLKKLFMTAKSDQDLDPDQDLDWFGYLDPDMDPH